MDWWQSILPLAATTADADSATRARRATVAPAAGHAADRRQRDARAAAAVAHLLPAAFFDYPVKLNANTIRNLGLPRMARIGASYAARALSPASPR